VETVVVMVAAAREAARAAAVKAAGDWGVVRAEVARAAARVVETVAP
jgi:hypothetical protein